jgi:hypothetical protein
MLWDGLKFVKVKMDMSPLWTSVFIFHEKKTLMQLMKMNFKKYNISVFRD